MHFLDTHAVIWLYQGEVHKFSEPTKLVLEKNDLFISPLIVLELQYLFEIKRIKKTGHEVTSILYKEIGLQIHNLPLSILIESAIKESWTRDPFDRMITSHAKIENAFLITKDEMILQNYKKAIW